MKPFTKSYFDLSELERQRATRDLEKHPHVVHFAKVNGMTRRDTAKQTMEAWRDGTIEPVHDERGSIIGFK